MPRQRRLPRRNQERMLEHFCQTTSVHGLKHIYEDGNLLFERFVWILVFLSGICFSGYFCWQMWQKWEQSPMLTSVETHLYPLKNVPFPAVTICNVNKVSERKLHDAILGNPKFNNVTYSKLQSTLRYMTKLDRAVIDEEELLELSQFYRSLNISASELYKILKKTAPACSDMIMDCNWLGLGEPCMKYFSFLPTDDGMCCTFNGGKYFDTILGKQPKSDHAPLRVNGNGFRMGLTLVIDANLEDCSVINGKFDGFKVLVHSPEEFPDVADRGFVVGLGTETFVGVKATTSFYTEEVTREVSAEKRQCVAEGEKQLKYFNQYSRSACFVECDANLMIERCHCRPYFFKGENKTELCELKSFKCIAEVYDEIRGRGDEVCDCLPPCTDTWYEPEVSYASFPGRGFNRTRTFKRIVARRNLRPGPQTKEYLKSNVAMLHVFYKEKTGMRYRTDIRFGVEDFISAMGGLLGLGLGMSFISAIEILYFLFFRRFFLWYRTNWSTQKIEKQSSVKPSISSLHTVQYKRRISNFSTTSSVPASMTTLTSLTSLTFPHLPIPLMTPSPLTNTIPPPVSNETHFQFPPATPATSTILPLPFQMISTISNPSMDVHPKVVRRASLDLPPLLQARLNKY